MTACVIEARDTPSLQYFETRAFSNPPIIVVLQSYIERTWHYAPYLLYNIENNSLMIS